MKYLIKEIWTSPTADVVGSGEEVYYYGTHNSVAKGEGELWKVRPYAYKSRAAADRALQQKEYYAAFDKQFGRRNHTFEIVEA